MNAKADRLLWPEEVAAKLGVTVGTLKRMAKDSRRAHEAGKVRAAHLPLQVDKEWRDVPRSDDRTVRVHSPRWSEAAIDEFIAKRPGSPGRTRS